MAKKCSLALAVVLVIVAAASDAMTLGGRHEIRSDTLIRNARPYRKDRNRRLEQNNFEIDGSYYLKFSQCVDVKLLDNDLFDQDVIEYAQSGQIISTKSFVLFHVCQENDCYYESEDNLYIVDLSTYLMNAASYLANANNSYCEACDVYYASYCGAQADDGYQNDDDAVAADDYASNDDAGRKLQNQRRTTNYIDCSQCESLGCLNNDDDDDQQKGDEDNTVVELIEELTGCLNTGLHWNDDDVYVGFMCSPYGGDGVELAIFLDNECSVYTNLKAFGDIPSWYIYDNDDLFAEVESYIKGAFSTMIPCNNDEFGDPSYQNSEDDDVVANEDANGEMNGYCGAIFEEEPVAFNSCIENDDQSNGNNNNNNDDDQYNWYSYDMVYDDSKDLEEVCLVLQQKEGEYEYQYDAENSGTWNDYSGSGGTSDGTEGSKSVPWSVEIPEGFATSGIAISLYVILAFSIVLGVIFTAGAKEKKRRKKMEPIYHGGRLV